MYVLYLAGDIVCVYITSLWLIADNDHLGKTMREGDIISKSRLKLKNGCN